MIKCNYNYELAAENASRMKRERKTDKVTEDNWSRESYGSIGVGSYSMDNIYNAYTEYRQTCYGY